LIGTPAKIDSSIAGTPAGGSGDLDVEVVPFRLRVQARRLLGRALGVVGDQRRELERDPAVDAGGAPVHVGEEVGRVAQVGDRDLEEGLLAREPLRVELGDLLVVVLAARDRLFEDRRVGGEAGDRELVDVALQHPLGQHRARDVVEPEALPQLVQTLRRFHEGLL
jgi:hypothetical protein